MSPKETTALRLDVKLLDAMREVKATEGIPVTTQIEFAVREWLTKRGAIAKTERKRAVPAGAPDHRPPAYTGRRGCGDCSPPASGAAGTEEAPCPIPNRLCTTR
jgi:hypothetical protein